MCCGSAGMVTLVPSSSVRVSGNAATGEGLAVGAGVAAAVGAGVAGSGVGVPAAPPQAARTVARTRRRVVERVRPRRVAARRRASTDSPAGQDEEGEKE